MSEILSAMSTMVIEGNFPNMVDITKQALEEGLNPEQILNNGLMPGMDQIGADGYAANAASSSEIARQFAG